ncbi:MAG: response regulator [Candidatus Krumholzibacteriota bacterium]|nr:response regulator [Candidatus Krumholzibacteriota bacterium]
MALNVLIVDDSSVMRAMIKKTLRLSGLPVGEICEAENGVAALERLEERWLDLALVDINMPVMNGIDLIEEIRRRPAIADLVIMVVSTESSETRIESLRRMGVDFVHKPFTPEDIKRKIENLTGVCADAGQDNGPAVPDGGPDF